MSYMPCQVIPWKDIINFYSHQQFMSLSGFPHLCQHWILLTFLKLPIWWANCGIFKEFPNPWLIWSLSKLCVNLYSALPFLPTIYLTMLPESVNKELCNAQQVGWSLLWVLTSSHLHRKGWRREYFLLGSFHPCSCYFLFCVSPTILLGNPKFHLGTILIILSYAQFAQLHGEKT